MMINSRRRSIVFSRSLVSRPFPSGQQSFKVSNYQREAMAEGLSTVSQSISDVILIQKASAKEKLANKRMVAFGH